MLVGAVVVRVSRLCMAPAPVALDWHVRLSGERGRPHSCRSAGRALPTHPSHRTAHRANNGRRVRPPYLSLVSAVSCELVTERWPLRVPRVCCALRWAASPGGHAVGRTDLLPWTGAPSMHFVGTGLHAAHATFVGRAGRGHSASVRREAPGLLVFRWTDAIRRAAPISCWAWRRAHLRRPSDERALWPGQRNLADGVCAGDCRQGSPRRTQGTRVFSRHQARQAGRTLRSLCSPHRCRPSSPCRRGMARACSER